MPNARITSVNETNIQRAVATVATANYMPQTLAFFASVIEHNPHIDRYFVLITDIDRQQQIRYQKKIDTLFSTGLITVITANDCGLGDKIVDLSFYYTALELCCALKPVLFRYINEQTDVQNWLYIDNDMHCVGSLNTTFSAFAQHAIFITSERNKPHSNPEIDCMLLGAGGFNAGVIGITRSDSATRFIDWFCEILSQYGFDDWRPTSEQRVLPKHSLFADQKWLNLVPCYFDDVIIHRDRGVNLCQWAFENDPITLKDGQVYCGDDVVYLLHLSHWSKDNPRVWQLRHFTSEEDWDAIIQSRIELIKKYEQIGFFPTEYGYARFTNNDFISLRDRRAYYKLLLQGKVFGGSTPFEQYAVVRLASSDFSTYDHISPNMATISLDYAFPKMIEVDKNFSYWRYLNKAHKNKFYADSSMPMAGFINRDEVHLLYNLALLGQGQPALEIGCWMGWSAAHMAAAGVSELHIVDPNLSSSPWQESVRDSLTRVGVLERCVLHTGYSPEALHTLPKKSWRIIFIDGNHDGEGPLADAVVVSSIAADTSLILFHDLLSPDVAKGLRFLKNIGWHTGLYLTAQVMGVAWRGDIMPIAHQYDRNNACMLPAHLDEFQMLSC